MKTNLSGNVEGAIQRFIKRKHLPIQVMKNKGVYVFLANCVDGSFKVTLRASKNIPGCVVIIQLPVTVHASREDAVGEILGCLNKEIGDGEFAFSRGSRGVRFKKNCVLASLVPTAQEIQEIVISNLATSLKALPVLRSTCNPTFLKDIPETETFVVGMSDGSGEDLSTS